MIRRSLAALLIAASCQICLSQDDIPTPVPDPAPNALPFNGPIEKRLEAIAERFNGTTRKLDDLDVAEQQRYESLRDLIDRWRRDEDPNIDDETRRGILGRLGALIESAQEAREERQELRAELRATAERWTPLQNIVERLEALVWKLFRLVMVVVFVAFICMVVLAVAWAYIRKKLLDIPNQIADAVVKPKGT